jgi:serine/arginine repetitive matrix protein 2
MYNGIGLNTPRGSGTNGYVSRNLSFVKPSSGLNGSNRKPEDAKILKPSAKKPSREVMLHKERRRVEIELLELREKLELKGVDAVDADRKVEGERQERYKEVDLMLDKDLKMEKEKEMDRLSSAFAISPAYKEGDSFRFVGQKIKEDVKLKRLENK